jgi:hypothetical protein
MMRLIIEVGIKANAIATTKDMNSPLTAYPSSFSLFEIGNGAVVTINLNSGLPVAYFNIDS